MKQSKDLPLSGYSILSVFTVSQRLEPKEAPEADAETGNVGFAWDWRLSGPDLFDVLVKLSVGPAQERPYEVEVSLVGRFRREQPSTSVGLADFAHLQAVAILLPYVRQAIANLSVTTQAGPYHLPSVNVVALMKGFRAKDATGARQLADLAKADKGESTGSQKEKTH